jgi:hypothetical protein
MGDDGCGSKTAAEHRGGRRQVLPNNRTHGTASLTIPVVAKIKKFGKNLAPSRSRGYASRNL